MNMGKKLIDEINIGIGRLRKLDLNWFFYFVL